MPGYLFDNGFIAELMRNLAFDDALPLDFPLVQLDFDKDPQRMATMEALYNAQNPDLTKFKARGGKLIMWHGWDDIEIPATVSVEYYKKVEALMGGAANTASFFRLYMVPGVAHCRRGPGADAFDELSYLEAWVEHGVAPDVLTAYHLKKEQSYLGLPRPVFPMDPALYDWSRPVFPYPVLREVQGQRRSEGGVVVGQGEVDDRRAGRLRRRAAASGRELRARRRTRAEGRRTRCPARASRRRGSG